MVKLRKVKKLKKPTVTKLKHKLDEIFSKWIRARDKRCVCCNSTLNLQCGHYMSRIYLNTRWDEENCHACCVSCNVFKNGNMPAFTAFLEDKFGFGIVQQLQKRAQKIVKLTPAYYLERIEYYKQKLKL